MLQEQVPNDKAQLQDLIQRHIQLIRVDCADERTKRQLIVRLCELRIKLNEISEEEEAKFVCGHSLAETYAAPSNQRTCDVCLKKPKTSLIVPLLLSNSNPNPILTCLFCTYPVHQQCSLNQVSISFRHERFEAKSQSNHRFPFFSNWFEGKTSPLSSNLVRTSATGSRVQQCDWKLVSSTVDLSRDRTGSTALQMFRLQSIDSLRIKRSMRLRWQILLQKLSHERYDGYPSSCHSQLGFWTKAGVASIVFRHQLHFVSSDFVWHSCTQSNAVRVRRWVVYFEGKFADADNCFFSCSFGFCLGNTDFEKKNFCFVYR